MVNELKKVVDFKKIKDKEFICLFKCDRIYCYGLYDFKCGDYIRN